jgi:PAS domain S-box-containing protein
MARQAHDYLKEFGEFCCILTDSGISDSNLHHALEILGQALEAGAVALMRKQFLNRDTFVLKLMGHWQAQKESQTAQEEELKPDYFNPAWWEILENQKPVVCHNMAFSELGAMRNLLLVPVSCQGNLFGILSFSDFENEEVQERRVDVAITAAHVLELWADKIQREKQMEEVLDLIPNPIIVLNTDGVVTGWNKPMEQISGRPADGMLGKGNYEHALPFYNKRRPTASNLIFKENPELESSYLEFQRKGDTLSALALCETLPGGGAFVASTTGVLHDATGRPSSSIHFIQDVTREREMAKNLRRSEAMYRTLVDFAGVGIVLFRGESILYHNEHFAELIGMTEKNITFDDFISWIDPSETEVMGFFKAPYEEGKAGSRFEFKAHHGDGDGRSYQGYAKVIGYEDQAAIHFILGDITEQRALAEKARVNELRMHHEDRLTALGVMAAGIAHELNQPLNTVRVITDGLLYGRDEGWELDEKELFEGLEMVSRQVLRMSDVIQNIRDFAREDRGKSEDIDPNDAIRNVFSMIGKQFLAHGIDIDVKLEPNLPCLKGNANNLEQVIMNLVVNARQALEEHRPTNKKIWVRSGFCYGQIFIEVGDNAVGFSEDLFIKIFDPFFTTKEPGKGTGLGLSISKTIVSDFKGLLKAYNNGEGGATFFFTIPPTGDAI